MKRLQHLTTLLISLLVLGLPGISVAQQKQDLEEADGSARVAISINRAIRAKLSASRPGLGIGSIEPSQIAGLYAVTIINGPVLYTTEDGEYFVLGDLYQAAPGGFVNLAELAREGGRAELMAQVKLNEMIVFSPKELPVKASIMVFTDVDCFYCQKLHNEVPDLNRIGIEVRYLAYPRAGIGSDSYKKMASAWCADDKQAAMTKLKNRQRIAANVCPNNPVEAQFQLGKEVGVSGTPALVTTDGKLMPGYMPALQLANALGVTVDPVIAAELEKKQEAQKKR
jgi:thiol:disulfide interchange protein DsbC